MNTNLEIKYYIDMQNGVVTPFIQKKDSDENEWKLLKKQLFNIEPSLKSKEDKRACLLLLFKDYFMNLLSDNYEFKEINAMLMEAFSFLYNSPYRKESLDTIEIQLIALREAFNGYGKGGDDFSFWNLDFAKPPSKKLVHKQQNTK